MRKFPRRAPLQVEQLEGRLVPSTITIGSSKDNTLYQSSAGTISNGAGSYFIAGETSGGLIRRGVIAFDIADNIPAGSAINSVTLTLHMSQTNFRSGSQTVELHRLSADWGEGTSNADSNPGQGAPAQTGDATWIYRFYSSSSWTNAGGDFTTTVSASTSVGSIGFYTWGSTTQMVNDVKGWLDNPSTAFGWLLLGNESTSQTAKRFDTKENSTADDRPMLTIDYTSTSSAASLAVTNFPSPITAGTQGSVTVTAKDASGNTATDYRGTVHFTSSDTQAGLPANYAFTAADAGVHNFNVTLKTAGTQSITATDTATGSITGSQSGITVTAAAADHLIVAAPAGATAGTPFDLVVTAKDPFNNTASGYTGTVSFTSTDGGATLPDPYTFTASDNGVHTFSGGATLILAGSQTITATDTTTSSTTGASTVLVSAAAVNHFSITTNGTVAAGMPFDLIVTALDAYGNTVTGYTGTVTFTTSDQDPQVSLPPDYTFTAGDNGTHTFSGGATLYTSGPQTITVTDTSDSTVTGTLTVTL